MNPRPVGSVLGLIALCLCGFLWFPGHTYLQQDSQIYLPMMEHIADPALLANDLIATHPHLSFTLYDEISISWKRLTGRDMQEILVLQQFLTRLLGLVGIWMLARSARLTDAGALLVTGIFALGATVIGPSVLTFEYEPTPRSFAMPLILFAAGLAAEARWGAAGAAAAFAMLYHPPTAAPVLGVLTLYAAIPGERGRRWYFYWLCVAIIALGVAAKWQAGVRLPQEFFSALSPDVEQMQRVRTAYVFTGLWIGRYWPHHFFLLVMGLAAWWRVRRDLAPLTKWLLAALPVIGVLSLPVNWILLDWLKWGLMPQYQPARIVLFTTLCAVVTTSIAAAGDRPVWERALWLLAPFSIIIRTQPLELKAATFPQLLLIGCLSIAGALAMHLRLPAGASAALIVAAMWLIPNWAGVRNYPSLHTPELAELSAWARTQTPRDAVFHFADEGKGLSPGIFRARALRAVWVDWKGGGQVNFMEPLAREWWRRWNGAPVVAQYLVRRAGKCEKPLFSNANYCVIPNGP